MLGNGYNEEKINNSTYSQTFSSSTPIMFGWGIGDLSFENNDITSEIVLQFSIENTGYETILLTLPNNLWSDNMSNETDNLNITYQWKPTEFDEFSTASLFSNITQNNLIIGSQEVATLLVKLNVINYSLEVTNTNILFSLNLVRNI